MQGSWKAKLRDRFKFLRRLPSDMTVNQSETSRPCKRRRLNITGDSTIAATSEADREDLKTECSKRKRDRKMTVIQDLTANTFSARRLWIEKSQPPITEILDEYPSLKFRKIVCLLQEYNSYCLTYCHLQIRMEFRRIVGLDEDVSMYSLMETWPIWKQRIIGYSHLEKTHRPKVREMLNSMDSETATSGSESIIDSGMHVHVHYLC